MGHSRACCSASLVSLWPPMLSQPRRSKCLLRNQYNNVSDNITKEEREATIETHAKPLAPRRLDATTTCMAWSKSSIVT